MEELNDIKKVQEIFEKVGFWKKINYCFSCQNNKMNTIGALFGAVGVLIATKSKKAAGYLLNSTEEGICLIPIIADTLTKNKLDIENPIIIKKEEMERISIKNQGFGMKNIIIKLKNKEKYNLSTASKIKKIEYHEENVKNFIEYCNENYFCDIKNS